jgi:hypothetical protein
MVYRAQLVVVSVSISILGIGCSDYDLIRDKDDPTGGDDTGFYFTDTGDPIIIEDPECELSSYPDWECGVADTCEFSEGGFNPIVEWEAGAGRYSRGLPTVGDLNRDGVPEILANFAGMFGGVGSLVALHGDGSGILWELSGANIGYASASAIGDLDGDGSPEVVTVKEYASPIDLQSFNEGDYTVVVYNAQGGRVWESQHFVDNEFGYGGAPILSDMDHDGSPEIVVGRVILNADGTVRGIGQYGRGSAVGVGKCEGMWLCEGSLSAVADLDLDGVEEVLVGNAAYDIDGNALWYDNSNYDGTVSVANLDSDPEGEMIVSSGASVRALDTDGSVMWGPRTIQGANIVSPAAIGDVDNDGMPEILVAGGNTLLCLNHDNTVLWSASVTDETGATGASIFDFEGDGIPEVVYIDEVEMVAFDGMTGAVKFYNSNHSSDTMYDYPVVADVDADGHAEIVVAHAGSSNALSVYGDRDDSWAPARGVWNQHSYSITNIHDDLSIPRNATQNFTTYNSFHAGIDRLSGENLIDDLEAEILEVCSDDCDKGALMVLARVLNKSAREMPAGIPVSLYAEINGVFEHMATRSTTQPVSSGMSGEEITFTIDSARVAGATSLRFVADDQGTGGGVFPECSETNNDSIYNGSICD